VRILECWYSLPWIVSVVVLVLVLVIRRLP
jgi:hypothetical protein